MAIKIELKRSAVPGKVPTTSSLELGEVAINTYDGKAYFKKDDGTQQIVQLANVSGSVISASYAETASYALNTQNIDTGSLVSTSSFNAYTSSTNAFSASILLYTASQNNLNGTYATTGSNIFKGDQNITGSINVASQSVFNSGVQINGSNSQLYYNVGFLDLAGTSGSRIDLHTRDSITSIATSVNNTVITSTTGSVLFQVTKGSLEFYASQSIFLSSDVTSSANIRVSGSMLIGTSSFTPNNNEKLIIDAGNTTSFNLITARTNVNNYSQFNITNKNSSVSASTDIVATNDLGTEGTYYVDLGINSSQFSGQIGGPNDAYLYTTGSNLLISNLTNNKNIIISSSGNGIIQFPSNVQVTGSLTISGSNTFTNIGPAIFSGSVNVTDGVTGSFSGSLTGTASYANNADTLDGIHGTQLVLTSSFNAFTASINNFTSSITNATGSLVTTASFNAYTSSINSYTSSLNSVTSSFVRNSQTSSMSVLSASYAATASFAGNFTVANTLTAQTLVVQTVSSSIIYSSGSNRFGNDLTNTQVFTGSVIITGSLSVNGSNAVLTNQTSSFATTSSFNSYTSSINSYTSSLNSKTSSFATTGSNNFIGTENITGSLNISGSTTFTGGSGTTLLSTNADTLIFTGSLYTSGSTSLSGSITISGSLSVNDSNVILTNQTSSFSTTSSFNAYTSSLNNFSASILSYTASQNNLNGTFATTSSFNNYTASINAFSASINSYTQSLNSATGAFATFTALNAYTSSINSFSASILSFTASQNNLNGTYTNTSSFNSATASLSSSIAALSSSFLRFSGSYNTGSFSGSFKGTFTGSFSGSLNNLQNSLVNHIPYFSSSQVLADSIMRQVESAPGVSSIAINSNAVTTAAPEALYVFQDSTSSFNVISGKGNLNNYLQLNIQNVNNGTSASSDIVATANNGNETSLYIDMGINNQNYVNNGNGVGDANDAYLYSTGNNLHIGNASDNGTHLGFFVGGFNTDINKKLELRPDNLHELTGSLDISGSLKVLNGVTGSFSGSLAGTASFANNATSASYSTTSSFVPKAIVTASAVNTTITFARFDGSTFDVTVSQSGSVASASFAENARSASYAQTASYALNTQNIDTGSLTSTSSFNAYTSSINTYTSSLNSATGAFATFTALNNYTSSTNNFSASILSYTASQNNLNGTFATTSSLNALSSSFNSYTQSLNSATGAFVTYTDFNSTTASLNNFSASILSYTASQNNLNGTFATTSSLNAYTSSINSYTSSLNSVTSSFVRNSQTSSFVQNSQTSSMSVLSASYAQTSSFASNFTVANTLTAQTLIVQTVSSSVVYSSGSNVFGNSLANTQVLTGSVLVTGSLSVNGSNVVLTNQTGAFATFTALNAYTSSINSYTSSLNSATSSFATSASFNAYTSSLNSATSSFATSASFNSYTSSINSATSSFATSASFNSYTSSINSATSSFATTGSNIFVGNQTITGSFLVTGSTTQIGNNTLTGNTSLTGSITVSGSQTFIGTNTITGSVLISGSTTQVGNNTLLGNTLLSGSITISGSFPVGSYSSSVNIYGDTSMIGYLKFNPQSTNIDSTVSASYIYVSGSTNDLYFTQNSNGYNNTIRLRWLEGNLYTGLLNGGLIGSSSSTVYTISSGSGIIVNLNASLADNPYPTVKYINWPTLSASIAPLSASYDQTFVAIDTNGQIYAQGTPYFDGQLDTLINIGLVGHQNRSTIGVVKTQPTVAYGIKQRQNVFISAFGPLKLSGFTLNTSSSLGLTIGSGTAFADGANYPIDPNNPSYVTDAGTSVSKIWRYRQSGSAAWVYDTNAGAGYTVIDPANYSNSGSLTAVPGTGGNRQYSIQRVFWFPNSAAKSIVVYYGNATYATEVDAIANINIESFNEAPNTAANAIYLGALILRNDALFTDTATYKIVPGGLFRSVGGSGGGGAAVTSTLAGLSDVNITSPTDGQALIYDSIATKWKNLSFISASISGNAATATTASYVNGNIFTNSNSVTSASYAVTASYVPTGIVTASAVNTTITFTRFNGSTFDVTVSQSGSVASASYAENAGLLDGKDSTEFVLTSSFNAFSASINTYTSSLNSATGAFVTYTNFNSNTSSFNAFSASILSYTASQNNLNGTFATTSSLNTYTSSINSFSASILSYTQSLNSATGAFATFTALNAYTSSINSYTSSLNSATSSFVRNSQTSSMSVLSASFAATASTVNLLELSGGVTAFAIPYVGVGSLATGSQQLYVTNSFNLGFDPSQGILYAKRFNGTSSYADNADLLDGLNSTAFVLNSQTSSMSVLSASYAATASFAGNFTVANTLTAQTLVVQTVSSSVVYSSGSNRFGNDLTNTQVFTGSVIITGSASVNGSNIVLANQTSSLVTYTNFNSTTASLNNFSASILSYTQSLNSATGAFATFTALNAYTSSINTYTSSLNSATSSFVTYTNFNSTTASLNNFSASILSYTQSLNNATSSFVLNSQTSSFATFTALNAYTSSTNNFSASILTYTQSLNAATGAFATFTALNAYTSSINTYTSSLNAATSSFVRNSQTSSMTVLSASYAVTSSYSKDLVVAGTLTFDATLNDYSSIASTIVGSNNLFTQPTASYTSGFFKYTVRNGTNARTGEVMAVWNGTSVEYTDMSTRDLGNTADVTFVASIVTGNLQFNATTATSGWNIKTLATFI